MTATGPIRALVVDDSEFFAEMTAATLTEEHDIEATFETNAQAALDWLEESRVDCIVSDYEMPEMDGLTFLERVQERYDDLPFILLTGRGDEEIASRAIASGVADYLLKLEVVEDEQYERLANRIEGVVNQQQTQKKYERLVENSPDAIAHVTESGTVLAANPALVEGVDIDCESLVGTQLEDALEGNVGQSRLDAGREAIETGETVRTEDSYDGRFFHNIFVPVETRRAHDSFQFISRDITERREREAKLERQNERLDSFASVVSHDLRNPLNVAQSSVELLHDEIDSDHLDRIDRSLVRMGDIIEDVLTLARQGETVDSPSPVDLETMAEDAWSYVETGNATLVVETERRIEADSSRLQELLTNLFRNSVEHGEATTITVGSVEESNADHYGFYVADDGTGIPPENWDEIFESGFSTGRKGTGLGLTIVEDIANAHGWSVAVADSDEGGARFEVTGVTER
ncbi:MAG: response regulator [Haloarculaceae archaeon]